MMGIIVTGHGGFANGMKENVKMLAGNDVEVIAVPFTEGMALEELEADLEKAMDQYAAVPTLVFADLTGGTPYNKAATLSVSRPNIRVFGGSSAAMLMDAAMRNVTGDEVDSLDTLAEEILESGRENMGCFILNVPSVDTMDEEDGI
ncbi:MAG: PTS sugar transporter subunit IIA [Lachnospiraceae bacterium]|nr:PTS sugar transporter subunit IIA [Lachnospiraceae bacterium]